MLLLVLASPVRAQNLADQRWEEPSFGLNFFPPRNARIMENATDGARIKFITDDYDVSLFIEKTVNEMSVEAVKGFAAGKLSYPYPDMVKVVDEEVRIADRPGWKLYHTIPRKDSNDFVIGQAFTKIDPKTFAVLQFQCDNDDYERIAATFESILDSAAFTDTQVLEERRVAMLDATSQWQQNVGLDRMRATLIPEQWFRIVEGDKDIGYMRVTQREGTQLDLPGIQIEVRLRITEGPLVLDQDRDYFLADDGTTEVWSVRGTRRVVATETALPQAAKPRKVESWAETGLASDGFVTVDFQSDADVNRDEWEVPKKGYLSQVQTMLMPGLLPGDAATTYGFYAYYSNTQTLTLWTRRVEPLQNGAYLVIERPSPDVGERRATYDKTGRLLREENADGRVLLATTREQMKRLHGIE